MRESEVPDHINAAMYFPIKLDATINDPRGLTAVGEWMKDNIGKQCEDWEMISSDSMYVKHQFFFKHDEDKVKFILRWL